MMYEMMGEMMGGEEGWVNIDRMWNAQGTYERE